MSSVSDDMRSATAVVGRLYQVFGTKNDKELADRLHIKSKSTISSWRTRNSVPYTECVQISIERNLSLDWLLLGIGEMSRTQSVARIGTFDVELLSDIIDVLERVCAETRIAIPASKKARAILFLYEEYQRGSNVEPETVMRVLRLVA